ncbi:MAG: Holliday junction branch migration DNA helicase RuvB [bacterium]|nr:Holliday junction branch migration DNA helicase RuvB [bacterium]
MFVKTPPTEDREIDNTLRPRNWEEYVGQQKLKNNLRVIIDAAKQRNESLEHLLFYGGSGLGKTTIAHVIAHEMGVGIRTCAGPALEKAGDIASILSNLEEGSILFIDECHRVNKSVVELLYSAMEDYTLHLVMGKGPMARTMELALPRFSLMGATTRPSLLPAPFRNRFGAVFQLEFYNTKDMEQIIRRSSSLLNIEMLKEAETAIAERSRQTPRIANRLLKRVRDFATTKGSGTITPDIASLAFSSLGIDEMGLEQSDRNMLLTIITRFKGGPVGIQALASSTGEDVETILDVTEPYLLQIGFLERTPRGRVVTRKAYEHLKISGTQQMIA